MVHDWQVNVDIFSWQSAHRCSHFEFNITRGHSGQYIHLSCHSESGIMQHRLHPVHNMQPIATDVANLCVNVCV